jgi:hypothetical protein
MSTRKLIMMWKEPSIATRGGRIRFDACVKSHQTRCHPLRRSHASANIHCAFYPLRANIMVRTSVRRVASVEGQERREAMAEMEFLFSGRRIDVEAALAELRQVPEVASVTSKEVPQKPSILKRGTQRQFELYDVIVSIVLSLASSAAYDGIKGAIAAVAKKRDVRVNEAPKKDGDET